uniref:SCP domain-containing protein n=1 Tax=Pavo cristatus TaxID=9049 RepID=A0A8C9FU56_PAVCR
IINKCIVEMHPYIYGLCFLIISPTSLALSTNRTDQQKLIVDKHNALRRRVSPPASNMLRMCNTSDIQSASINESNLLSVIKKKNTNTLHTSTSGVTCGENILLSSQPKTWAEAIKVWHSQSSNFKYGFGATTKSANVKNYAQLVWYNSYQVGCAVAYCPKNQYNYFYVCHYCPPGNNIMQVAAPYKKGPRCADCPGHCERGLCSKCTYFSP